MTSARAIAFAALRGVRPGQFAADRLDTLFHRHNVPPVERRLATQLTLGVVRRAGSLDALFAPFLQKPPAPVLRTLLHLGAYQLAFLDGIPAHAALHETVALARAAKERGFVNAVLRHVQRALGPAVDGPLPPAADRLPLDDGRVRQLLQPLLPDPVSRPTDYLQAAYSLPRWLAAHWQMRHGGAEASRLAAWSVRVPPLWLRPNPLRTTAAQLAEQFTAAGVRFELGDGETLRVLDGPPVPDLPGYADGLFTVQDVAAGDAARAVAPQAGERILDLCAAPGGKATQLAELMGDCGEVVACDRDPARLALVTALCQRLGLSSVRPVTVGDAGDGIPNGPFDAALADVPCSNTGVLARRPEARWRVTPEEIDALAPLQATLLRVAADRVRPGGRVVYSTCSNLPAENGERVRAFLRERPDYRLDAEREHAPGRPSDGAYWARLVRIG